MEILTTNIADIEGQSETSALARAASNTQTKVEFATELDCKLQVKTSPDNTSMLSRPERSSPTGTSSSNADSSSPETSLIEVARLEYLKSPSATSSVLSGANATTGPVPANASLAAPPSYATKALATRQQASANMAGSTPGQSDLNGRQSGGALQASFIPAGAEFQPAGSGLPKGREVDPRSLGNESDPRGPSATINTSTKPAVETPVPPQNVAAQFCLLQPSGGANNKRWKAPSESPTTLGVGNSTLQPIGPANTNATDLHKSTNAAGPTLDQTHVVPMANLTRSSEGLQEPAAATLPLFHNATTELEFPTPSNDTTTVAPPSKGSKEYPINNISPKWTDALDAVSLSRLGKGSQNAALEITAPIPNVTIQSDVQGPTSRADALEATSPSRSNEAPSNASLETDTSLPNVPAKLELHNLSSGYNPKPETPQDKGSMASSAAQATPINANTTSYPLEIAQVVGTGQVELGSAGGSDPPPDPTITIAATPHSSVAKGLQNTGMEPTLTNPRNGLRPVGPEAPSGQPATHAEVQGPSSAPQEGTAQQTESSGGSALRAHESMGSGDDDPTIAPAVTASSLSEPFGLTMTVSPEGREEPVNSKRSNDSQVRSNEEPVSSTAVLPDIVPDLFAQGPAQTQGQGAAFSAGDTKQADASNNKREVGAIPDLTKTADASGGSPKAGTDPLLAPQSGVPGRVEGGSASPGTAGAPQGSSAPDNARAFAGYQSTIHGAVSSARLTQQAGNAEMQVRLQTEALGPIDVHTIVKGNDLGASIHVEAHDTQVMMANELPRLEQALNDRSLRVQRLDVLQGSVSESQSGGTGPGNYHGNPPEPHPNHASLSMSQAYPALSESPPVYDEAVLGLSTTRINLRV